MLNLTKKNNEKKEALLTRIFFFYRTTNARGSTGGANKAVNGYMSFLLYSVAGLACEFLFYFLLRFFTQ